MSETGQLSLVVGSFNLGAILPPKCPKELLPWLPIGKDVYSIVFQESHFEVPEEKETSLSLLKKLLLSHLDGDESNYSVVSEICDEGMCLVVIAREAVKASLTDVKTFTCLPPDHVSSVPKGSVGVSLRYANRSWISFVGCHFPAHAHKLEERDSFYPLVDNVRKETLSASGGPDDHDLTFWFGDLNYRVELDYDDVIKLIAEKKWEVLVEADQLKRSIREGKALTGYEEGEINFPPSYKYKEGMEDVYQTTPKRVPSYVDRILWRKGNERVVVTQKTYTAIDTITTSDHHPVRAEFLVTL
eukprot:TRINITY_DN5039_c0_g1_i1.p1 TRINITY_DN5039_c0_g1~~TRINITY_DN5039_c0_g1_i1.p1  ORF type:complete len:330 (-),score=70.82 TRINITY_DN5039_c0_g1_i1:93-995(-)